MIPALTPDELRRGIEDEFRRMCEVKAAARRPVPDTIITDDPVPPCYVRPADLYTRVRWCGE